MKSFILKQHLCDPMMAFARNDVQWTAALISPSRFPSAPCLSNILAGSTQSVDNVEWKGYVSDRNESMSPSRLEVVNPRMNSPHSFRLSNRQATRSISLHHLSIFDLPTADFLD
jgi:hypothetical protein